MNPLQPRDANGKLCSMPPMPCAGCGEPTLSIKTLNALPLDERDKFRRRHGHGRCMPCYRRYVGEDAGHEGRWKGGDLVEEYEHLASYGYDRKAIAKRLGVSYRALSKAIERYHRTEAAA